MVCSCLWERETHCRAAERHLLGYMGSRSVTCHPTQVNATLTAAKQAGTRFTYPGGMEGWVDPNGWLYAQTVQVVTTW